MNHLLAYIDNRNTRIAALAALALLCIIAWWFAHTAFLAAYLSAWWFCCSLVMGGLANVWVHNMTGGYWGEAIRVPLLALARRMWLLALLFLPLLLGMHDLYPWVENADAGPLRWAGELPARSLAFKSAWLMPGMFAVRSISYLAIWTLLAYLSQRPGLQRSTRFSALALIVYGLTAGWAGVDWIMTLMPLWFSSIFGMLAGVSQMFSGMALAVVLAARRRDPPSAPVMRDLGNLLLMYVLTWAYLAFSQFLIIWAEDLPHEIVWYIVRSHTGWLAIAWVLVTIHFFAPLLILLFRNVKESASLLGWLAVVLLASHLLDVWWSVLPSLEVGWQQWLWTVPLATLALGAIALAAVSGPYALRPDNRPAGEGSHG